MKKILLAVTAALAITGCSQNEEFENAGQNAVINFESIVSNATRATEMKLDELKTQGFHVYAYNTGDAVVGTGTLNKSIMENLFHGIRVTINGHLIMHITGLLREKSNFLHILLLGH